MIQTIVSDLITTISLELYDTCLHIMESTNENLVNTLLIKISHNLFILALGFLIGYMLLKLPSFMNMEQEKRRGIIKENKSHIQFLSFVIMVSFFAEEILRATFYMWNRFFDETKILILLKESALAIESGTVAGLLIFVVTIMIVVFITILQMVEVIALCSLLVFSPIFLVISIFNRKLPNIFIQNLISGVSRPLFQALTLGLIITFFYPIFKENTGITNSTEIMFLFISVVISFNISKGLTSMMLISENKSREE